VSLQNKIESLIPIKDSLNQNLIGIEKEGLRVSEDGSISQSKHPEYYGSALTNPSITTDFSEALIELVTKPIMGADKVIDELNKIHHYVHNNLPKNERFWPASMPCILRGKTNIPIANYGSSNLGMMKTVYRRGLANRYGSVMQAIAGIHFNYSFSAEFWKSYQQVMQSNINPIDFMNLHYMGLTRNFLRYGWLITYLFGASSSVCKSFMKDNYDHDLEEFDDSTLYLPYATSLRMGDIGYQNSQEDEKGVKANYNSLQHYIYSLRAAMKTSCDDFEKIGLKKDGEYLQLNTNILQIANEYYSSVRPKPILYGNDRPLRALKNQGIGYIEIRSLDINPLINIGIDKQQIQFLEAFLLYCLLEESPPLSTSALYDIDKNASLIAHQGRQPGLNLYNNQDKISRDEWADKIFIGINKCSSLLSIEHQNAVKAISLRVHNPDLTPSAIMLNEMQNQEKGFFEYTDQFSHKNKEHYKNLVVDKNYFDELNELSQSSQKKQKQIEASDQINFDQFLEKYMAYDD